MTRDELGELFCDLGRRMYERNLVAATDGNLSCRFDDDTFLITRSGVCKGWLRPADILLADAAGNRLDGEGKVSSEFFTHLAAYEERPDIQAVIHAHPPIATSLTLAGVSLMEPMLPEIVMAMGAIPTCPYATPGTREGGDSVRENIRKCDTLLLDRHGALTVGASLLDAYYKLERLEHAAQMIWHARCLGGIAPLNEDQVTRIRAAATAYGVAARLHP